MTTTLYLHGDCLDHDPGPQHPESPGRYAAVLHALQTAVPAMAAMEYRDAPLGTREQVLLAHDEEHWRHIEAASPATGRRSLDPDTHLSPSSRAAALRGVGAACAAVDLLQERTHHHVFCLTRPPGHHATAERAMGFCVFNQIAIAALHAQKQHGVRRIAIVDFDVHHGNGTQDIVLGRPDLLYLSTHQFPHYPGTGSRHENRAGNIHNIPLPAGTDDSSFRVIFKAEVLPQLEAFAPELLLVSAGFDAHGDDPLASLRFTDATYGWLGEQLAAVAMRHCQGRLLSTLEGGYNLDALGRSVLCYLKGAEAAQRSSPI
jgi:acetoin utilization deacetylase AcuC-like enzyme